MQLVWPPLKGLLHILAAVLGIKPFRQQPVLAIDLFHRVVSEVMNKTSFVLAALW